MVHTDGVVRTEIMKGLIAEEPTRPEEAPGWPELKVLPPLGPKGQDEGDHWNSRGVAVRE